MSNSRIGIYVPVFNGEPYLDNMLGQIEAEGYLPEVKIIDDASTDRTPRILKRWQNSKGLVYESMEINGQKIGSIKKILEKEDSDGVLPDYVVLHDGDSYIRVNSTHHPPLQSNGYNGNGKVIAALEKAIFFMQDVDWAGMGLKDVPLIDDNSNLLEKLQFKEYIWDRTTHVWLGKKGRMRCVPGAGGIFKSRPLLDALRHHSLRHDGDDMETTVLLERDGHKVGYYSPYVIKKYGLDPSEFPEITIDTRVPHSFKSLVKQRIRWTTGAIETYFKEGGFHLEQMEFWSPKKRSRLGAQAFYEIAKLITYPGWYLAVVEYPESVIPISIVATSVLNTLFTLANPEYKEIFNGSKSKMAASTLINLLPLGAYSFVLDTVRIPGAYVKTANNYLQRKLGGEKKSEKGNGEKIELVTKQEKSTVKPDVPKVSVTPAIQEQKTENPVRYLGRIVMPPITYMRQLDPYTIEYYNKYPDGREEIITTYSTLFGQFVIS